MCAGTELPDKDYGDLDWAPSLLDKAAVRAGLDPLQTEALRKSTDGAAEAHPGYIGDYSMYEAPTYLSSLETSEVSALLDSIDPSVLLASDVVEDVVKGVAIIEPRDYLVDQFEKLRDFYRESANRRLAVLLWWD
jgi:hypothetical protein